MANNYTEFSFAVDISENAYTDFTHILEAFSSKDITDLPDWYKEGKYALDELEGFGIDYSYRDGIMYVWNDGEGDLNSVVEALQAVKGHYNETEPVAIQYACTCSKPRTDEFGGGVVVVGPWQQRWEDTSDIARRLIDEMKSQLASQNESTPTMS